MRLKQGSYADVDRYELDPVEVALGFVAQGARRIHLVDLNAARGSSIDERKGNRDIIRRITAAVDCAVEVGGGVRTEADVAELLQAGVTQVVAGTTLARDPHEVGRWVRRYGPVVLAGIDAKDGQVKVAGWEQSSGITDVELARIAADIGCAGIIYTNIARDGMMQGPDIEATSRVAAAGGIPVILSGGISKQQDIAQVIAEAHPMVGGIIAGKALYEQAIDPGEVLEMCRQAREDSATVHVRLWNSDGRWDPGSSRVKPAMVLDQDGVVRAVVSQNAKATAKSTEQNEVWQLVPENGRVLPAELPPHQLEAVTEHRDCIEVRARFAAPEAADTGGEAGAAESASAAHEAGAHSVADPTEGNPESVLLQLEQLIRERKKKLPEGSYTTHLFTKGEEKIRKKTGEEAVELILARNNPEMIAESADLIYHLLVLLAERDIPLAQVIRELSRR